MHLMVNDRNTLCIPDTKKHSVSGHACLYRLDSVIDSAILWWFECIFDWSSTIAFMKTFHFVLIFSSNTFFPPSRVSEKDDPTTSARDKACFNVLICRFRVFFNCLFNLHAICCSSQRFSFKSDSFFTSDKSVMTHTHTPTHTHYIDEPNLFFVFYIDNQLFHLLFFLLDKKTIKCWKDFHFYLPLIHCYYDQWDMSLGRPPSFPSRISWKKLMKDQCIFALVITGFVLRTIFLD